MNKIYDFFSKNSKLMLSGNQINTFILWIRLVNLPRTLVLLI